LEIEKITTKKPAPKKTSTKSEAKSKPAPKKAAKKVTTTKTNEGK
jgi:hypothetical protein